MVAKPRKAGTICAILIAVPLTGHSAGKADPAAALSHAHEILVVPIQSPPPFWDFPVATRAAAHQLGLDAPGPSGAATPPVITAAGARVTAATAVVGLATATQQAKDNTGLTWAVANALSANDTWVPSRVAAQVVAAELTARGMRQVRIRDGVQPVAGVDGCETAIFMGPCAKAIGAYQRADRSPFSYAPPEASPDTAVLEVLVTYEMADRIALFVSLKLTDQASGALLARGHSYAMGHIGPDAFENGGEKFKAQFASLAEEATKKAVKNLGI